MKYFTKELLDRFNSSDIDIAEKAHDEWEEALNLYRDYLDHNYEKFPPVVRSIIENNCFHDAQIISFYACGKVFIKITPENGEEKILEFNVLLTAKENTFNKSSYWLYEEFEIIDSDVFKLSVLLCDLSELEITFIGDLKEYEPYLRS